MEYLTVDEAREKTGLKLVLTAGVPGPWGEAAKAVFHLKGLSYLPVRQDGGMENDALRAWTGRDGAPIAMLEGEPPRDGWADILALAERLAPEPRLVPEDASAQADMFGLAHLICGPGGFAWQRRLMLLGSMLAAGDAAPPPVRRLAAKYGATETACAAAPGRVRAILERLVARLDAQHTRGSDYFVGDALTALDLYWATFAAMLEPLPETQCPMPPMLRSGYQLTDPSVRFPGDRSLLAHRDLIYERHLELPVEF